jgi:hypothetical protein
MKTALILSIAAIVVGFSYSFGHNFHNFGISPRAITSAEAKKQAITRNRMATFDDSKKNLEKASDKIKVRKTEESH